MFSVPLEGFRVFDGFWKGLTSSGRCWGVPGEYFRVLEDVLEVSTMPSFCLVL